MELRRTVTLPVVVLALIGCVVGSIVKRCGDTTRLEASEDVSLSGCSRPPCQLKRKTSIAVELKFKPEKDVEAVRNSVHAYILGIPFPFIGVDGANVCEKMFDAGTGAKAACPLNAGVEYVYRDEFKILEIYPKLKLTVHWALKDDQDEDILCFEVPAKITA